MNRFEVYLAPELAVEIEAHHVEQTDEGDLVFTEIVRSSEEPLVIALFQDWMGYVRMR